MYFVLIKDWIMFYKIMWENSKENFVSYVEKKYILIMKKWYFVDYLIIIINNDWGLEKDINKK